MTRNNLRLSGIIPVLFLALCEDRQIVSLLPFYQMAHELLYHFLRPTLFIVVNVPLPRGRAMESPKPSFVPLPLLGEISLLVIPSLSSSDIKMMRMTERAQKGGGSAAHCSPLLGGRQTRWESSPALSHARRKNSSWSFPSLPVLSAVMGGISWELRRGESVATF